MLCGKCLDYFLSDLPDIALEYPHHLEAEAIKPGNADDLLVRQHLAVSIGNVQDNSVGRSIQPTDVLLDCLYRAVVSPGNLISVENDYILFTCDVLNIGVSPRIIVT